MSSGSVFGKVCSFVVDVRAELDRVSWPSRKEVIITTIVVFVIALISAIFFALVDTAWYKIIHSMIGK
ncbi:MAG: preprotein translocase subunit SecE [Holosporales bacterium]|jgi:preprotein translocase subunit SecE|nr:preprotein translocase subunit SecE [Holosporales bacterium]